MDIKTKITPRESLLGTALWNIINLIKNLRALENLYSETTGNADDAVFLMEGNSNSELELQKQGAIDAGINGVSVTEHIE